MVEWEGAGGVGKRGLSGLGKPRESCKGEPDFHSSDPGVKGSASRVRGRLYAVRG